MQTATTIPAGLADYAAARGYTGGPWIAQTFGHTTREPRGWTEHESTEVLTVARLAQLREHGWTRVCVHWDYGVCADFVISELSPITGLRGNPASFPVERG